jgi:CheY-like chemotaxis protein
MGPGMIILAVDDDHEDRELFSEALSIIDKNIICIQLKDGVDALQYLESDLELPDIIFLDINMPKMDGIACLEIIRSNSKYDATRVIMFSTSRDGHDLQKVEVLGSEFITKPNSFTDLLKSLKNVINQQRVA